MTYWVFDLDGTMVDSFAPYFSFLEEYLQTPLDHEKKRHYIAKHPLIALQEKMSEAAAQSALQELVDRNKREVADIPVFAGIRSAVDHLRANQRRISVWTSRDYETAKILLDHTGLSQVIDHLVAGDQVTHRKPHPEGMLKIQELYKCQTHELVMIGDHEHDMQAAKALGIKAVRASWHEHWQHESCTLADHQFYKHTDFHNWVSTLN